MTGSVATPQLLALGGLRLATAAVGAPSGRRKDLAVLAYLARRTPQAVSRAELATLIWGERDEASARHSLRQTLLRLKRILGDDLVVHPDAVAVRSGLELDARLFEIEIAEGRLREAVSRYEGDFLAGAEDAGGEAFRLWVDEERVRLRKRVAWAFERLVAEAEQQGRWPHAVALSERWANLLPLDERAHLALTRALRLAGRSGDAIVCHSVFGARVRAELGVEPSPEFRRLGVELERDAATAHATPSSPGSSALFTPDLVGRAAVFAELVSAWGGARGGAPVTVLVDGEAGIGKTRLCEEFLRWLEGHGDSSAFILRGRAIEHEREAPWSTARALLARIADAPGLLGAPASALGDLSRLVPSIRERVRQLPEPRADDPEHLADALVRVLSDVAEEVPVAIFLDDFATADTASRQLLLSVMQRLTGAAVLFLCTARVVDLEQAPELRELHGWRALRRLRLPPLGATDVEAMLSSMMTLPHDERHALAVRLHDECGGNPFYIIEIVASLMDEGYLAPDSGGEWRAPIDASPQSLPLPANVRDAVARRIAHLGDATRDVAEAAAVYGELFRVEPLAQMLGAPTASVADALDELTARKLVRPATAGVYEFSHHITRRVAYDRLAAARRRELHAKAAVSVAPRRGMDAAAGAVWEYHCARAGGEPSTHRRGRKWVAVASVAVLIGIGSAATVVALIQGSATRPAATAAASPTVAILPFAMSGSADFAYLGEGIADLLSVKLRGVADLRPVDTRALFSRIRRDAVERGAGESDASDALTPDGGRAVAARFGAAYYVLGGIVEVGGRIQIQASLYDRRDGGRAVTDAAVEGSVGDLFRLVDDLAAELLAGRTGGPGSRLARLAAVTTDSLSALKAYLDGERAIRNMRFDSAVVALQRAVEIDSTFALAHYKLAVAANTGDRIDVSRDAAERALRHGALLSQHDRDLLEAMRESMRGSATEAERLYTSILRAHPDDAEAWFHLGDLFFHINPLRGRSFLEARAPFERVLAVYPDHRQSMLHLIRLAGYERRRAELDSLMSRLQALRTPSWRDLHMRAVRAFALDDLREEERVIVELRAADAVAVAVSAYYVATYARDYDGARRLALLLTEQGRPAPRRAEGHAALAHLELARGRWRAASRHLAAVAEIDARAALTLRAVFLALPFLPVPQQELRVIRDELLEYPDVGPPHGAAGLFIAQNETHLQVRAYLAGLLSARLGDSAAIRRYAAELGELPGTEAATRLGRALAQGLGAQSSIMQGRAADAYSRLERPVETYYRWAAGSPFFSQRHERYVRAELLRELGRGADAITWYASFEGSSFFDVVYVAQSHLRRAEIFERLGDHRSAAEHYARFIALRQDCDAEFRPQVDGARQTLARLRRTGGLSNP